MEYIPFHHSCQFCICRFVSYNGMHSDGRHIDSSVKAEAGIPVRYKISLNSLRLERNLFKVFS